MPCPEELKKEAKLQVEPKQKEELQTEAKKSKQDAIDQSQIE